jgi:hypothetical protein
MIAPSRACWAASHLNAFVLLCFLFRLLRVAAQKKTTTLLLQMQHCTQTASTLQFLFGLLLCRLLHDGTKQGLLGSFASRIKIFCALVHCPPFSAALIPCM